jgi:hypothetical protein
MRVHTRAGRLAALAVLVASSSLPTLAACSDQAGAEAGRDTVVPAASAEVRSSLVDLYTGDRATADDTDAAECFADALLERVTPRQLRDGGILDAANAPRTEGVALSEPVAEAWTEAQMGCTDFVEESTQAQEALTDGRLDAEAYAACLDARLTATTIHEASVSTLMAHLDDPAVAALSRAQSECSALSVLRD